MLCVFSKNGYLEPNCAHLVSSSYFCSVLCKRHNICYEKILRMRPLILQGQTMPGRKPWVEVSPEVSWETSLTLYSVKWGLEPRRDWSCAWVALMMWESAEQEITGMKHRAVKRSHPLCDEESHLHLRTVPVYLTRGRPPFLLLFSFLASWVTAYKPKRSQFQFLTDSARCTHTINPEMTVLGMLVSLLIKPCTRLLKGRL